MKIALIISSVFLLFFACTPEKNNSTADVPDLSDIPAPILKKIENIQYLDTANFNKIGASISAISKKKFEETPYSELKMLAEKFCKKSKGYQKGIWEGQNDCTWAVEKYKLKQYGEWVTRVDDNLLIKLKNGSQIEYTNDRSNPDQILYYQFKNYFQDAGFFLVETIQEDKCRISNLINANDGSSYLLNGTLYFSKDQSAFLAASFDKELPFECTNKVEFYKIADTQIEKMWHVPTGDWGVTEVKFLSQKDFLLEQSTTDIPLEYKRFAKVSTDK